MIVVDGVNYTTIQQAINACPANGGTVFLPPGTYAVNAPLTLRDGIRIIGSGCGAIGRFSGLGVTQITTTLTTGALFPITQLEGLYFSDFAVFNSASGSAACFLFNYGQYVTIERFCIYGGFAVGMQFNPVVAGSNIFNHIKDGLISTSPANSICILLDSQSSLSAVNNSNQFDNLACIGGTGGTGISIIGSGGGNQFCNENSFRASEFTAASGTGISVQNGRDNLFLGCTVENCTLGVALGTTSFGTTLLACELAGNTTQVADTGIRTFITGNIGGTVQVFGVSQTGSVRCNSLTMGSNTSDIGTNSINVPNGTSIYAAGNIVANLNGIAGPGGNLEVVGKLVCDKSVSIYGGLITVQSGISSEVATVNLTGQTAAITTTTLYAVPAAPPITGATGLFRVSWNAKITTAATTGASTSTLGALTIVYTDPDGVAITLTAGAMIAAGSIATSSAANTTSTVLIGLPLFLNCKASTNITHAFAYASNTASQMAYSLNILLEAL